MPFRSIRRRVRARLPETRVRDWVYERRKAGEILTTADGSVARTGLEQELALKRQRERDREARAYSQRPPARVDFEGAEVRLYPTPPGPVLESRANAVDREPWTVRWLLGSMADGDVLWDVGANVGAYSLIVAKAFRGRASVVAIEPGAASFEALVRNVVRNDASGAVTPLCVALGARDAVVQFSYATLDPGEGRNAVRDESALDAELIQEGFTHRLPVLCASIDTLVGQWGLPHPTHLKVDVEQGEVEVLQGGTSVLASAPPKSVMVEVRSRAALDAVARLLQPIGLELARVAVKTRSGDAMDAFFARDPEELRSLLADLPDRGPR
jgi:FkbM family methyltransferase